MPSFFPMFDPALYGAPQQKPDPMTGYLSALMPPSPVAPQFDPMLAKKQARRDAALQLGAALLQGAPSGDLGLVAPGLGAAAQAYQGSMDYSQQMALRNAAAETQAQRSDWQDRLAALKTARGFAADDEAGSIRRQELEAEQLRRESEKNSLARVLGYVPEEDRGKAEALMGSGMKGAERVIFDMVYPDAEEPKEPKRGFMKGPDGKMYMWGLTPVKEPEPPPGPRVPSPENYSSTVRSFYKDRLEELSAQRDSQQRASGTRPSPADMARAKAQDEALAMEWAKNQAGSLYDSYGKAFGAPGAKPPPAQPEPAASGDLKELPAALNPAVSALVAKGLSEEEAKNVLLTDLRSGVHSVGSILRKLGL